MTSPRVAVPMLVDGPSNRPLLDALASGDFLGRGLVLVRRDGRIVPVEDALEADWLDLDAQLSTEPLGAALAAVASIEPGFDAPS